MSLRFVCVAVGDGAEKRFGSADLYVDRLYNMLRRYVHQPFQLFCVTDRPRSIHGDIAQIDCSRWDELRQVLQVRGGKTTRMKLGLFNPQYMPLDEFIYLDITLVIRADFAPLLQWMDARDEDLLIAAGWRYEGYNSCVMRIRPAKLDFIYRDFCSGVIYPAQREGDQDFITGSVRAHAASVATFPSELIQSFKDLCGAIATPSHPPIDAMKKAVIVKFHGKPKMHDAFGGALPRFVKVGKVRYFAWGLWLQPRWIRELNRCWISS